VPNKRPAALLGAGVAIAAALALWLGRGEPDAAPQLAVAPPPTGPQFFGAVTGDGGPPIPGGRDERRRHLLEQVKLTDHTYCSYLEGSKYPME